ncbi:MAG TPA: hypothetical protein VHD55_02860 [Candidatus Paceibacterota bacterium]|nr:hypothetical protein [Candidatus Paceibacterota bacterium]
MNTVVQLTRPEDLRRTATELAAEAEKFHEGLNHAQEKSFYSEMRAFSMKLLPLLDTEIGRKLQRVLNDKAASVRRTVATETHVLMDFTAGSRSPQQFQRVRELLSACVDLPLACVQQTERRYA